MLTALRATVRLIWFVALLLAAIVDGVLRGPKDRAEGAFYVHRWARRVTRAMGLHPIVTGTPPTSGPVVLVSNHLSYLDALLYTAAMPLVMVSKSEVRRWPLIGWIAARAGTVFIQRANVAGGRTQTREEVNAEMAEAMRLAPAMLFFPEGTSSDGTEVLPFRRGLFHSVLEHGVPVRAAAMHYSLTEPNPGVTLEDDVCYHGKHDFLTHLFRFLGLRGFQAHLHFNEENIQGDDHYAVAEKRARSRLPPLRAAQGHRPESYRRGDKPAFRNDDSTCSTDQSSDSVPSTVRLAFAADGITYRSAIGRAVASYCWRTDSSVRPRSRTSR